jgi:transcriptional regulator with XRE-family HTH domain
MAMLPVYSRPAEKSAATEREEAERKALVEFGRRIARLRRRKGWSQATLAQQLGMSRERLGHWERGEHNPPLAALLALRQVLGIAIDELVSGEPAEPSDRKKETAVSHLATAIKLLR